MGWNNLYQSRVTTADQAVEVIHSGNRIFLTGNVFVPKTLLGALVKRAASLENIEICQALTIGPAEYVNPDMEAQDNSWEASAREYVEVYGRARERAARG